MKSFLQTLLFKFISLALLTAMALSTLSCKKQETTTTSSTTQQRIIEAKAATTTTHLFYSGVIQPLKTYNITSPVDGVIDEEYFKYGEHVIKNQLLMTITSTKSQQDYATALTNYIKDKDQYLRNKTNFEGTTALFKAGIVDREDYLSQKSQLGTSELAYINSTNALKAIMSKIPGAPKDIETLTLHDVATLEKTLQQQYDKFNIEAPISGIALTPEKSSSSEQSGGAKILTVGSEVKQNQIVVSIGDMSGLSVAINVSEIDINKIARGEKTILTSPALPGMLFYGKVTDIGKQAKSNESGAGIATFPVVVIVDKITPVERDLVKVGMNAKVDLAITSPAQIKIPIAAVFMSKGGSPTVTIIDAKSGKQRDVTVETGITDINNVTILKGLNEGDKVVVGAH